MHFSIPDTQEIYIENSSTSTTFYNIYINGFFHCSLRYKQILQLHDQLRRRCNDLQLPTFPPKRLLPLTNNQLEIRRAALEQYLQLTGQDSRIAKLDFFQNFLLNAQLETAIHLTDDESHGSICKDTTIHLDVTLMSGHQLEVEDVRIGSNANELLQRIACDLLRLPKHLMPYFCLFLGRIEPDDTLVLLRLLMDFESVYLSRRHAHPCQIYLRKAYWDPAYDLFLMPDTTALNLLYVQARSDIDREWIIATPEVRQKLQNLQNHNLKKEYIEVARQLPLYGCIQFSESVVDYPEMDTVAIISIGNKELSMRTAKGQKIYETKFRVTRMRCWRVTAIHNTHQHDVYNDNGLLASNMPAAPTNLQLAFEYLMSKQKLRWITITSSQAMLMSVCLQSMVDELLSSNSPLEAAASSMSYQSIPQSRSNTLLSTSSSFSNEPLSSTSTSTNSSASSTSSPTVPVKFIAQQQRRTKQNPRIFTASSYAAVFFRNAQEESIANGAFEGIGDDDL